MNFEKIEDKLKEINDINDYYFRERRVFWNTIYIIFSIIFVIVIAYINSTFVLNSLEIFLFCLIFVSTSFFLISMIFLKIGRQNNQFIKVFLVENKKTIRILQPIAMIIISFFASCLLLVLTFLTKSEFASIFTTITLVFLMFSITELIFNLILLIKEKSKK